MFTTTPPPPGLMESESYGESSGQNLEREGLIVKIFRKKELAEKPLLFGIFAAVDCHFQLQISVVKERLKITLW